jgi:hypothetical protein
MTLPFEEKNALENTEYFLYSLLDPRKTPRVPLTVRKNARCLLKHYPHRYSRDKLFKNMLDGKAHL